NSLGSTDTAYFDLHVIDGSLLPVSPENLNLTRQVVDQGYRVAIDWQLTGHNLKEVDIYRATEQEGTYSLLAVAGGSSDSTGYTDTDISLGKTYYYYLLGKNEYGNSAPTDTASVTFPALPPVPPVIATIPVAYVAAGR